MARSSGIARRFRTTVIVSGLVFVSIGLLSKNGAQLLLSIAVCGLAMVGGIVFYVLRPGQD